MQKMLILKMIAIALLMAVIAIPLTMIEATIYERSQFRNDAVRSIANDSVGEQMVVGPVLALPYVDSYTVEEEVVGQPSKTIQKEVSIKRVHYVFPNELQINGAIDTEQRYRGIHPVLTYTGLHAINGDFVLPKMADLSREKTDSRIRLEQPYLSLGVKDTRGVNKVPTVNWGGKAFEFKQDSRLPRYPRGLHAPLETLALENAEKIKFSMELSLSGMERMDFVPVAKFNQVTLKSKWPHPQFGGRFLPQTKNRVIDENGFNATWNISALALSTQDQLIAPIAKASDAAGAAAAAAAAAGVLVNHESNLDNFGVAFIEPVNIYTQSSRAVKYGLLFIALTFAAFFLFEIMKQLPIHPVQYALVGLALVLFFLLLVSLSEHLSFLHAYLIATVACIGLIGFYLANVLGDWKRGFAFATGLSVLYGVLFGLLQSENNALVLGSTLLFAVLAVIMVVTRKVDWYQLSKNIGKPAAAEVTSQ